MFSLKSRFFQRVLYQLLNHFEVRNSKKFLGRGSTTPSPETLPSSFSGFALDSGIALKSRPNPTPQLLTRGCALVTTIILTDAKIFNNEYEVTDWMRGGLFEQFNAINAQLKLLDLRVFRN